MKLDLESELDLQGVVVEPFFPEVVSQLDLQGTMELDIPAAVGRFLYV